MPLRNFLALIAAIAIGMTCALVASAEIDRLIHPEGYPMSVEDMNALLNDVGDDA
jgi:hypothetical protein